MSTESGNVTSIGSRRSASSPERVDEGASSSPQGLTVHSGLSSDDALALVAHDMRSALCSVQGWALTLLAHWPRMKNDDRKEALQAIRDRSATLLGFAEDVLDIARSNAGQVELRFARVDISEVVRAAVRAARAEHPEHRIRLRLAGERLPVLGDARRLQQVLMNLLANARRVTPIGSDVQIEATRVLDTVVVGVRDQGLGVAPEMKPLLFQKIQPSYSGVKGAGVGLYLCRKIVEAHGGRVWVSSTDAGATFGFLLKRLVPGTS